MTWPVVIEGDPPGVPLHWCQKPDCERLVRQGTDFCCTACYLADLNMHEIEAHSEGCDQRWSQRRPLAPAEGKFGFGVAQ